jgi:hypothetical protein
MGPYFHVPLFPYPPFIQILSSSGRTGSMMGKN